MKNNVFEKAAFRMELLGEMYNSISARREWYTNDENPNEMSDSDKWHIEVIDELLTELEKKFIK